MGASLRYYNTEQEIDYFIETLQTNVHHNAQYFQEQKLFLPLTRKKNIIGGAAYIAEVVRGGLQAMDKGQYEAAESLGLNYFQMMRLIILPQALKIVIPPTVGILISAFKDTSLVVIIALYDILNTTKSILTEPEWTGFSTEAYIFVAMIYYVCCFSMSQYSRKIEKELEYKSNSPQSS